MRLPNGYGSVYKLSGKRRRPYTAYITVGWDLNEDTQKATQRRKYLGYYATRKEALQALSEYNTCPYQVQTTTTLQDLYDKWSAVEFSSCGHSYKNVYQAAYKVLLPVCDVPVENLTLDHYQRIVDESGKHAPTLKKVRALLGKLYDYALMAEIITPAKREMVNHINIRSAENPNNIERIPFTDPEIRQLWDIGEPVHGVLIMIYTGLRVGEMAALQKEDVHLDERWLYVRKSKTKAGVRVVPIHEKLVPIFEHWMGTGSEYMFECTPAAAGKVTYFKWDKLMEKYNMAHKPHDCRHTCVSMLIRAGVHITLVKSIVGHASGSVTEDVYTHVDLKEKIDAINKL